MRVTPRYYQSVEIHRGTIGGDGRLVFTGTPASTVSGGTWERKLKEVVAEGEVYLVNAQGFLELGADVRRRDHLVPLGTGKRYEVMQVVSGHDHRGTVTHVGVELRDTQAY